MYRAAWPTVLALFIAGLSAAAVAQPTPPAISIATDPGFTDDGSPSPDPSPDDLLTGHWGGLRDRLLRSGIRLSLQDAGEVWANLQGGLRKGVVFDGLASASINVNLDTALHWTGASLFASAYQIHGRGPTPNLIGSLQPVSDLEATRSTRLYNLWLEQTLLGGRLNIRVGQEGANDELMISQFAAWFLNSSFGFPPLAALDLPSGAPNFPLATPMVRVRFKPTEQITVIGAVFNGDPAPPGVGDPQRRDASGSVFRMNDHTLSFLELWYGTGKPGLAGTYKIGAWYHSAHFADQRLDTAGRSLAEPLSNGIAQSHRGDHGVYAVMDQMLWQPAGSEDTGLAMFALVTSAPADRNLIDFYLAGGLNWIGPFAGRPHDMVGVAVAYAHISRSAQQFGAEQISLAGSGARPRRSETVVEATYDCQVTPWWTLQPDVQYVVNPGAGLPSNHPVPLRNAWVIGLHGVFTF